MKKYLLQIFVWIFIGNAIILGQEPVEIREGIVSYITSQSVYVKFSSTRSINAGDTLFIKEASRFVPALMVRNTSSISCVCAILGDMILKVSDIIYARLGTRLGPETQKDSVEDIQVVAPLIMAENDTVPDGTVGRKKFKQEIHGRLSLSSYSGFSDAESDLSQRMKYTFSLTASHIGGSGLSVDSYVSFTHTSTDWEEIKKNVFNGLKIYKLNIIYDFNESMHISAGRSINPDLSSVGAIDGIQVMKKFGSFTLGAFAGSRPDYDDYGFNPDLLQYGAYIGYDFRKDHGWMQNSLGFIEQTNHSQTDRRFIYFQHSSWLMDNLLLFASAEMDLYKKVNDIQETTFDLTNVYLALRYRIIKELSAGVSYTSRQPVIYYETYKDIVERLLENESFQGWHLRVNAHPVKYLFIGIKGGYRYRKEDPQPSKHVYGYVTYSLVPGIGASATLSTTWLETSYLRGNIYSLGISKDLIAGRLNSGLKYRWVNYQYPESEKEVVQHIMEANMSWNIMRKLYLSIYYEGIYDPQARFNRLYLNITQRF